MSKRNALKYIDAATAFEWKKETVDYLKGMEEVPLEMENDLMEMLRPHYKPKGHILLEPDMYHKDATYIRKGLVKLFLIDEKGDKPQTLHIWAPGEIVVHYKLFRKRLQNTKYYMEVISDAELVSISNDCMDLIYEAYPAAERLTTDILDEKSERVLKQTEILTMVDKGSRYARLVELFPNLYYKLSNEDICAFLGITSATLVRSKGEYV